jgi:hypothetical protein
MKTAKISNEERERMGGRRWEGGDGKEEMGRRRWEGGDGKEEMGKPARDAARSFFYL